MTNAKLLLIEDDVDLTEFLEDYFRKKGFRITSRSSAMAALEELSGDTDVDVVLCDLRLPGMSGLEFIDEAKRRAPETPILLMTATRSVENAVEAIRRGAYDFVLKPLDFSRLELSIERALKLKEVQKENKQLKQVLSVGTEGLGSAIGKSPAMRRVFELATRIAPSPATVLITGESGTGKEVIAHLLHDLSPRKGRPFVAINCSAIPENLLESELFGHAKGAFTGASERKTGLFEEAEGGTLFLDEIGDMPLPLQAKVLRALQERKIRRVGENADRSIDVRVLAATHRDLGREVQEKRFRQDLFFRLNVIPLALPPLRERTEDVLPLARHFLNKVALRYGLKRGKELSHEATEILLRHDWPGNVRELENSMERAYVLSRDSEAIQARDLFLDNGSPSPLPTSATPVYSDEMPAAPAATGWNFGGHLERDREILTLEQMSNIYVKHVYKVVGEVKEHAARALDIDRKTLSRRLAESDPTSFASTDAVSSGARASMQ